MRQAVLLCWVVLASCATSSPSGPLAVPPYPVGIKTTLLLIRDAGEPAAGAPVLAALEREVGCNPAFTAVVFLGDNIYPRGMPDSTERSRKDAERCLDAQVAAASNASSVYFVPGNHDWAKHGDDGWDAIRRQGRYLTESGAARMLPAGGCPGPAVVDLGPQVRLILLDTQWWLHVGPRPGPDSFCGAGTPASVVTAIKW